MAMEGAIAMSSLPSSVKYLVIGAGIHGLSSAWHLAKEQRAAGEEPDVLVIDKTGVGAGASGIACGGARRVAPSACTRRRAGSPTTWHRCTVSPQRRSRPARGSWTACG